MHEAQTEKEKKEYLKSNASAESFFSRVEELAPRLGIDVKRTWGPPISEESVLATREWLELRQRQMVETSATTEEARC